LSLETPQQLSGTRIHAEKTVNFPVAYWGTNIPGQMRRSTAEGTSGPRGGKKYINPGTAVVGCGQMQAKIKTIWRNTAVELVDGIPGEKAAVERHPRSNWRRAVQ